MKPKSIPCLRWVGEFVVIVVGVLTALAVDEWREYQSERERETQYLAGFYEDLTRDEGQLAHTINTTTRSIRQAEALILQAGGTLDGHWQELDNYDEVTIETELPEGELRFFSTPLVFTPFRTTYTSIISSGELHLIRNPDLRRALVDYYETVALVNDDDDTLATPMLQLADFLVSRGVDLFHSDATQQVAQLPDALPYLSRARDGAHWRLRRLQNLKSRYDTALELLQSESAMQTND